MAQEKEETLTCTIEAHNKIFVENKDSTRFFHLTC